MSRFKPNPKFPQEQMREAPTKQFLERVGAQLQDEFTQASAMSGWGPKAFHKVHEDGVTVGTRYSLAHFDEWGVRTWSGTQPIRRTLDAHGFKVEEKGKP